VKRENTWSLERKRWTLSGTLILSLMVSAAVVAPRLVFAGPVQDKVKLTAIGHPIWQQAGFQVFSAPIGTLTDSFAEGSQTEQNIHLEMNFNTEAASLMCLSLGSSCAYPSYSNTQCCSHICGRFHTCCDKPLYPEACTLNIECCSLDCFKLPGQAIGRCE